MYAPVLRKDNDQRSQCNYFSNSKLRSGLKIVWCEPLTEPTLKSENVKGLQRVIYLLTVKFISFIRF